MVTNDLWFVSYPYCIHVILLSLDCVHSCRIHRHQKFFPPTKAKEVPSNHNILLNLTTVLSCALPQEYKSYRSTVQQDHENEWWINYSRRCSFELHAGLVKLWSRGSRGVRCISEKERGGSLRSTSGHKPE